MWLKKSETKSTQSKQFMVQCLYSVHSASLRRSVNHLPSRMSHDWTSQYLSHSPSRSLTHLLTIYPSVIYPKISDLSVEPHPLEHYFSASSLSVPARPGPCYPQSGVCMYDDGSQAELSPPWCWVHVYYRSVTLMVKTGSWEDGANPTPIVTSPSKLPFPRRDTTVLPFLARPGRQPSNPIRCLQLWSSFYSFLSFAIMPSFSDFYNSLSYPYPALHSDSQFLLNSIRSPPSLSMQPAHSWHL